MKGNASAGAHFAVVADDEVDVIRLYFIRVLSGSHGDVAVYRGSLALNVDSSKVGTYADILFRRYGFSVNHIVTAYGNVALARLHRHAFFRGLDALGNVNGTLWRDGTF